MFKTIAFVAFALIYFHQANANIISCSHPEVCRMAQMILQENANHDITLENIILPTGDPHEFEPSIQDIKKLMRAPTLLVGPVELNPWMKNISELRLKEKNLKTIILSLPIFAAKEYPTDDTEALGHFWLYPKIYCHLKKEISLRLGFKPSSNCAYSNVESHIAADLKLISSPVILTHDALLPLLKKLSTNKNQIMALKSSTHHGEVSAAAVKHVYDALQNSKVIWIFEDNIAVSENVKNKIRKQDTIIKIDTAKSPDNNQDFSLLETLHKKLQESKK